VSLSFTFKLDVDDDDSKHGATRLAVIVSTLIGQPYELEIVVSWRILSAGSGMASAGGDNGSPRKRRFRRLTSDLRRPTSDLHTRIRCWGLAQSASAVSKSYLYCRVLKSTLLQQLSEALLEQPLVRPDISYSDRTCVALVPYSSPSSITRSRSDLIPSQLTDALWFRHWSIEST